MKKSKNSPAQPRPPENGGGLTDVREIRYSIDQTHPVLVKNYQVKIDAPVPSPSGPYPWKHPYCEMNYLFEGSLTEYIGAETIERKAGGIMMIGPGTSHFAIWRSYPQRIVTVHFLPIVLFAMGPAGAGARALARFTTPQRIDQRIITLPPSLARKNTERFKEMVKEFTERKTASELRLRALLLDVMVDLLRWEESVGRTVNVARTSSELNWSQLEKTLSFIYDHFSEPLYVEQIARVAGLSVSRLQAMFHEALGMSCVQYLRTYRISHASAMLCSPDARITDIALSVGFETLSHFNTSFRGFMGMSPTQYMKKYSGNRK